MTSPHAISTPHGHKPWTVAATAGLGYGAWAILANHTAGTHDAVHAGFVQFTLSFSATLFLVLVLERLFFWSRSPLLGFWLATTGTSVLAAALMAAGHALMNTPHILATITPSALVGALFYGSYASNLLMRARTSRMTA